ncbi:MAG: hypothetical protein K8U57_28815 [Planctomycetes bacterium]|nr:hypothetical protein [Planctomycetota bacterium]
MSSNNDMQILVGRTEQLIAAITNAILSSAEVAAERIELAANVARIQQRMSAFGSVLETVGAQKEMLAKQLPNATGPSKTLLLKQIAMLASQEVAILSKAGVAEPTAVAALAEVEAPREPSPQSASSPTHRRDGRRFLRVAPGTKRDRNGTADTKEGHDEE